MNEKINFDSHIPYYIQLMDILKEKVQSGIWAPGDQIPASRIFANSTGSAGPSFGRLYGNWNLKV